MARVFFCERAQTSDPLGIGTCGVAYGCPSRFRTYNRSLQRRVLYQLSYQAKNRERQGRSVELAEGVGFEPTEPFRALLFSRQVP